jgi:hypothetical protein
MCPTSVRSFSPASADSSAEASTAGVIGFPVAVRAPFLRRVGCFLPADRDFPGRVAGFAVSFRFFFI